MVIKHGVVQTSKDVISGEKGISPREIIKYVENRPFVVDQKKKS